VLQLLLLLLRVWEDPGSILGSEVGCVQRDFSHYFQENSVIVP
jgi:hypothetical protein